MEDCEILPSLYERPRPLLTRAEANVILDDIHEFIYDPFGHGSLLEQAVQYIVNKVMINHPITMVYLSKASRLLNEIIDREMRIMRIQIDERFVFESMNEFGSGGWMRVHDTTGKEYLHWSI